MAQDTPPSIRQFDVATIEKLGPGMFQQDQEAAAATDILIAQRNRTDLESEKVKHWIVETVGDSDVVRFVREGDAGLEAAYDISFAKGQDPQISVPQLRTLQPDEIAQFNARNLALRNIGRRCSERYNSLALRDPQANGWLVWALAATENPDVVVLGGHYRFTISEDGKSILSSGALSRSCFAPAKPTTPANSTLAALFSTQLVSNIPVETTVWINLQQKLPVYVMTPDRNLWRVESGHMRVIKTLPASKSPN